MSFRSLFTTGLFYVAAVIVGFVMAQFNVPLPWMIGPMLFAATVSVMEKTPSIPLITRPIGQLVVAASVGLFFTPEALTAAGQQLIPMLSIAVLTIGAGFLAAWALMSIARIDVVTASLASIPGGPVEMASIAKRHGAESGTVAFAQILRIALLVLIIPPLLVALDGEVADPAAAFADGPVDFGGAALLLAVALAGGFFFRAVRMTTPFFLGPLGATAAASALMLPVSAPPYFVLAGAQVLLGVWLGSMFQRRLFQRSPILIVGVIVSTAVLIILCSLMAIIVSMLTGVEWQTMVLAAAPGSVTEMALTAKILDQQVALVTAYHILRIFIILPLVPVIFSVLTRIVGRQEEETYERER